MIKHKLFFSLLLVVFLIGGAHADDAGTNAVFLQYPQIFSGTDNLKPGSIVNLKDIGIKIEPSEEHNIDEPGIYYLLYPRDLDIKPTDKPPYDKAYPYLHLNLPLAEEHSPTNFLIMSDMPESISEDNIYLGTEINGIDGAYAKSTAPATKRIRFMADHFNKSKSTKWVKVFITAKEDARVIIHKKGSAIDEDSVVAGTIAEKFSHQVQLSDQRDLTAGKPALLGEFGSIMPGQTVVIWYEMTFNKDACIRTFVTDKDKLIEPSEEELEALPKLKALKWKDKEEELKKLVVPSLYPSRYNRVLECFIHARGIFPRPDRYCEALYDYAQNPKWIQAYSAFEYTEGMDELTLDGNPVGTNNRGNYGSFVRMNIKIKSLPPGTDKIAVLAVNNSTTMGGMFKTTLRDRDKCEKGTFFVFDKTSSIIGMNKGVLLWKDEIKENSEINVEFFTLANTSVRMWYLLIPIK